MISLELHSNFACAHALHCYDGACKKFHGHNYSLFVVLTGTVYSDTGSTKDGMLIDFRVAKRIIKQVIDTDYDHRLILHLADPRAAVMHLVPNSGLRSVAYQPTAENMVKDIWEQLTKHFKKFDVTVSEVRLFETPDSCAIYRSEGD